MLACKGLKLLWIQKKQCVALSSHTKITKRTKEMRDPPFCKGQGLDTNARVLHWNAHIHTGRYREHSVREDIT